MSQTRVPECTKKEYAENSLHIPVILVTALLGVFCFDLHRLLCGESRANFYAGLVSASMLMTIKLGTANS